MPALRRQLRRPGLLTTAAVLALCASAATPVVASASTTRYMRPGGADSGDCALAATACRTIGYAYTQSAAGDVVQVAAGSYGDQTVTGTKSSPGVVFELDANARFTGVTVHATWVEFRGGVIDDYGWWDQASNPIPSNVTFRDVTAKTVSFNGGSNISVLGGSVGNFSAPAGRPTGFFLYGLTNELFNVLIDGVDFHDITHPVATDHFEAIRIDNGAHDVTIRNSKFRNITANTSIIFVDNTYGEPGDFYNLTLENNFFAAPLSGPGGGAYFAFNMNPSVQNCKNYAFRYNSFAVAPANLECSTKTNVSWIGNVAPKAPGCQGGSFSFNVWEASSSATRCSATDTWVNGTEYGPRNLGFVDIATGDLHLTSTSPARGAGDPASFPARDIDCGIRRFPALPDAGADEYGLTGTCLGVPIALPPLSPPLEDTTPPRTTISSGPSSSMSTSASISFTSSESDSTFMCRIDGETWVACTNPMTYSGLAVGAHVLAARAVDAAGNVDPSPATWNWSVTTVLFGNRTVEPVVDYNPLGQAQAFPVTAATSGTLTTLTMYVDPANTATTLVAGIYANSATDHPGTLLASARAALVAGTWMTLTVPSTSVTAGTKYWLAVLGTGSGTLRYRDRAGAGVSETSAITGLTDLPSTWITGIGYAYAEPSLWGS